MSIQGTPEDITNNQSITVHDGQHLVIYGGHGTRITSAHPSDKLLRGLVLRLIPYETDPRTKREPFISKYSFTIWSLQYPPLPDIGPPSALSAPFLWGINPRNLIRSRLAFEPINPPERLPLEQTAALTDWATDVTGWPDRHTLPISAPTLLQKWRLDPSQYPFRPAALQAERRLAMLLYIRMLGSFPLVSPSSPSYCAGHTLAKIRALLLYSHEAYKCITELDIEAIYQEVRLSRSPTFHIDPTNIAPTNPWNEWYPIINHVRLGHADIHPLSDPGYGNFDYTLRPKIWDSRFTVNHSRPSLSATLATLTTTPMTTPYGPAHLLPTHFPIRNPGCKTWSDLRDLRAELEDLWYKRILRGAPPIWRHEIHAQWQRQYARDNVHVHHHHPFMDRPSIAPYVSAPEAITTSEGEVIQITRVENEIDDEKLNPNDYGGTSGAGNTGVERRDGEASRDIEGRMPRPPISGRIWPEEPSGLAEC